MKLSNTTTKDGLLQDCEHWCNLPVGTLTSDETLFYRFISLLNLASDEVLALILNADQKAQWDDTNHEDLPIATFDLVEGQQDYSFTKDENDNDVLEIAAVYAKGPDGVYRKMDPVDASTGSAQILAQAADNVGTPVRYDKMANSILLDPTPDYDAEDGVRVVFARSQVKFDPTGGTEDFDPDQTPGIPSPFHRLYSLKASHDWLSVNKSENGVLLSKIEAKAAAMGFNLTTHIQKRSRDEKTVMRVSSQSSR